MAAVDQITEEYPEAEYVKLDLPRASEGKLYYDFNTISDFASEVKDSDKYYVNCELLAGGCRRRLLPAGLRCEGQDHD